MSSSALATRGVKTMDTPLMDTADRHRIYLKLFLASFLALYFEFILIRYLSTEIRVFAYLKNLPLLASFFGLGIGMILADREKWFSRFFPAFAVALFLLIRLAPALGLTHLRLFSSNFFAWESVLLTSSQGASAAGFSLADATTLLMMLPSLLILLLLSFLVIAFCIPLGGFIGKNLQKLPPLKGYAVDLLGSIAGVSIFTLLSMFSTPPWVWVALGCALLLIFVWQRPSMRYAILVLPLIVFSPAPDTFWSPYYRITLYREENSAIQTPAQPLFLAVNYDYHQKMWDLSAAAAAHYGNTPLYQSARQTYDLPYAMHPRPETVLIVGAGTGNDVAAALRHGAKRIDAVEIDPVILRLGRELHPERPYDSKQVAIHVTDARAFLNTAPGPYDLIVFGYLDSHTLVANSSFLRLDNYVYTTQSLSRAKELLAPDGTLVLAFAAGKTYINGRLYHMLADVFGQPPRAYATNYDDTGVVLVSGNISDHPALEEIPRADGELAAAGANIPLATDKWPFLYLSSRSIPSYYVVFLLLLAAAFAFGRKILALENVWTKTYLHFFMLGAAFLLLETKAITELSLLFGSTWIVNAVAVVSFLAMALAANLLLIRWNHSYPVAYGFLFVALAVALLFPMETLFSYPQPVRLLAAGIIVSLPVFFSGMLFSRSFRDASSPHKALGVNLIGALVGGVSENTVMLGGVTLLGILAVIFYVVSFIAITRFRFAKK